MRHEKLYLADMIQACEAVERFLNDVSEEQFDSSDLIQSAVLNKLAIVGEAASHISKPTKDKYPQVVWKSVIGFRNIAIHEYFAVLWPIVWETARIDVPVIRKQIIDILKCEYPDAAEE